VSAETEGSGKASANLSGSASTFPPFCGARSGWLATKLTA